MLTRKIKIKNSKFWKVKRCKKKFSLKTLPNNM